MRFTLHYDGPLPSRGSSAVKGSIREALEPQLRELWTLPPLGAMAEEYLEKKTGPEEWTALIERHGHVFAAVVPEGFGIVAELDVLMLRAGPPGEIVKTHGDIDNRLKTLFDALSAPAQANQVPQDMRPTSTADPMFVLLGDDSLISRVNVEAERLLAPSTPDSTIVTVRVTTRIVQPMLGNMPLGSA